MLNREALRHFVLIASAVAMFGSIAQAQVELDTKRWSERAYGMSLQPPLGTRLIEQTADDYLLRILDDAAQYQMTLAVRRSRSDLTLAEVSNSAKAQILDAQPASQILDETEATWAGLPGILLYVQVPGVGRDALVGQAVIQLNTQTYAVVEIRGALNEQTRLRQTLEAVLGSLGIADQLRLAEQRRAGIERGQQWRGSLTEADYNRAIGPDLFYRLLDGERDIGWMRVHRQRGEFNHMPGSQVVVDTHVELEGQKIDSRAEYFRPIDSDAGETWSIRTTVRPVDPREQPRTVVETGATTQDQIDVHIDGTGGVSNEHLQFPRPPIGYLTQADGWLLPWLLPHDAPGEYGCYWYNSQDRQLTFRTDQLTPALDGFVVITRLSPNSAELTARYDSAGVLIEKQLGANRKLARSDLESLKRLWNLRQ